MPRGISPDNNPGNNPRLYVQPLPVHAAEYSFLKQNTFWFWEDVFISLNVASRY